jgi:hypothetical protein
MINGKKNAGNMKKFEDVCCNNKNCYNFALCKIDKIDMRMK